MLTARAELADYPILQKFINLVVGLLFVGGFYYFMTGTLTRHTEDIGTIKTKIEQTTAEDTAAPPACLTYKNSASLLQSCNFQGSP